MSGPNRDTSNDDARISATAALIALGGHALIIIAVLMLAGRTQDVVASSGVVTVILVSGSPSGAASSPSAERARAPTSLRVSSPDAKPQDAVAAGERLDRLVAPDVAASASTSTTQSPSSTSVSRSPGGSLDASGGSGSSQADLGLGQGEGVAGIDLYAAASLPAVGTRPASSPIGDLWEKVAPCWRAASPRKATLIVEIGKGGDLAGSPQAVRRVSALADPQMLLAERAAVRALQACAPYTGLDGRRWRVAFP